MEGVLTGPGPSETSSSTVPEEPAPNWDRWERRFHVGSISLVAAIVVLAAAGLLGVRTGTITARDGGLELEVLHSRITRPGLATPWKATVSTEDGAPLPATVTLAVSTAYLDIFDLNGLSPAPSSEFSTAQWTRWEFDVPPGESSLQVTLDVRLEPAIQWAKSGVAAIEIDGRRLVSADFRTWVMP